MSLYGVFNSGVPLSRILIPPVYTYEIVTARTALPVTLAEVKAQLRLDPTDASDDTYLTMIVNAVSDYFEKYTTRVLTNTVFKTYRDCFTYGRCFSLRKAKVDITTVSINYLKNNVTTVVPTTDYYVTSESGFPGIYLNKNKYWPADADERQQAITIQFTAGFGALTTSIPADIKIALLNHIAALYENRGDCSSDACADSLPFGAKKTYAQYAIYSLNPYALCGSC